MVIPLYDDNSDRLRWPIVTTTLIVLNVLVFFVLQAGDSDNKFSRAWVLVPEEILTGQDVVTDDRPMRHPQTGQQVLVPGLEETPFSVYLTLLTSIFMHGSIAHLLGNMMFLWIFGDNVEDTLGHVRYILFYLLGGFAASGAHVAATYALGGNLRTPCLGASGAISAVLGGYLLLFPYRRVTVLMFRVITQVPAFVAIGMWFLFQVIEGLGMLGGRGEGGVAYGAHLGGFLAGCALVRPMGLGAPRHPEVRRRVSFNDRNRDDSWS